MADPIISRTSNGNTQSRLANPTNTQGGAYVLLGDGDMVVSKLWSI